MTPSDLQAAPRAVCGKATSVPAATASGPTTRRNSAAPHPHADGGVNPTGGVTRDTTADALAMPEGRATGGTRTATRADIAAGNRDRIAAYARAAVTALPAIRSAT